MNFFQRFFGHLKTVTKHRWWVCYYCFKAGIPWQGLVHDLSKFSPVEFWESVKYYQGFRSPIDYCKEVNGWSKAWMHHKGRNKHHYEFWQDNFDFGCKPVQMPYKYVLELICDFLGAGRAYNGKNFSPENEYKWWLKKKANGIKMHPQTLEFVNLMMEDFLNSGFINTLVRAEEYYNFAAIRTHSKDSKWRETDE